MAEGKEVTNVQSVFYFIYKLTFTANVSNEVVLKRSITLLIILLIALPPPNILKMTFVLDKFKFLLRNLTKKFSQIKFLKNSNKQGVTNEWVSTLI